MPDNQFRYKAGKLSFLLVCLFLCTACGKKDVVFVAGQEVALEEAMSPEEIPATITEEVKIEETLPVTPNVTEVSAMNAEDGEGKININTADAEKLMTLTGIGESRAAAIIEYRENCGGFKNIEEIMDVKGIGTGIFSKISSLICVK